MWLFDTRWRFISCGWSFKNQLFKLHGVVIPNCKPKLNFFLEINCEFLFQNYYLTIITKLFYHLSLRPSRARAFVSTIDRTIQFHGTRVETILVRILYTLTHTRKYVCLHGYIILTTFWPTAFTRRLELSFRSIRITVHGRNLNYINILVDRND